MELTVLVGLCAIRGIRCAPVAVPGLRLRRMGAEFLRVTHHLALTDTKSISPAMLPLPARMKREVIDKSSHLSQYEWQPSL